MAAALIVAAVPLRADAENLRLTVVVRNVQGGRPVAMARILENDAHTGGTVAFTDRRGVAVLRDVPSGTVDLTIYAPGFHSFQTSVVLSGTADRLETVNLAPLAAPATIATVHATTMPRVNDTSVRAHSAAAFAAGSLYSAVSALPDAQLTRSGLSIEGLAPGETQLSVDGIKLGGGGNSPFLSSFGLDLFNSLSVHRLTDRGGPGVDLTTEDPTIAFTLAADQRAEQIGGERTVIDMRGTSGNIGYALRHVQGFNAGPLNGRTFLDESGLRYAHQDESSGEGTLLKFRVPFNSWERVLVHASHLETGEGATCRIASGGVPCGYGPGNDTRSSANEMGATYSANIGVATASFSAGLSRWSTADNYAKRLVAGNPDPFTSKSTVDAKTISIDASSPLGDAHRLTARIDNLSQRLHVGGFGDALVSLPAFTRASIADDIERGDVQLRGTLDYASVQNVLGARLDARLQRHDNTWQASLLGSEPTEPALPSIPTLGTLDDPPSLAYDCATGRVFAAEPGEVPTTARKTAAFGSYSHRGRSLAVTVSASLDAVRDGQVERIAPIGTIHPSQLSAVRAFYESSAACGRPTALTANDVIVTDAINATIHEAKATVSLAWSARPQLVLGPFIQLVRATYATATETSAVPFQPSLRAGLIADYQHGGNEFLAMARWEGSNNANALPPFGVLSLGYSRAFQRGRLLVTVSNALNSETGDFITSSMARALPNGILPLADPLARRNIQVRYELRAGAKPRAPRVDALTALSVVAQPASDVFSITITGIPNKPPAAPFEIDRTSPACAPEIAGQAQRLLDALKIAAQPSNGHTRDYSLPQTQAASLGAQVTVHRRAGFVAFALRFTNPTSRRAFFSCVPQHFAQIDDARRRGLYVPTQSAVKSNVQYFDARVGAYRLFPSIMRPRGHKARGIDLIPPPASAPSTPFELRESCPAGDRHFATEILTELQSRFAKRGNPLSPSPYFRITPHPGSLATWWSIHFLDPLARGAVERCAMISAVNGSMLRGTGISGVAQDLNFANRFGLYEPVP